MSQPDVLRAKPHTFPDDHLYHDHLVQIVPRENHTRLSFQNGHNFPNVHHHITPVQPSTTPESNTWDGVDNLLDAYENLPILHTGPTSHHLKEGIEHARLAALANEPDAERAFFIADLSDVYRQFILWKQLLPGIEPFYAVKCNPDPYVLRLLAALGTGFDCASHGEISQVLSLGNIAPSRIIFANPCKATSFIRHAAKHGVDTMTFDNADELIKISRAYPEARLVLRILTDDSKSVCRLGLKFGAPLQTVPRLLSLARDLGLNVVGVSFHVGSGCYDAGAFVDAIALARSAFNMGKDVGYRFSLLDIGGGFEEETFEQTSAVIRQALCSNFADLLSKIQIIAEPGRFFVSRAFTLAGNVIARRAGGAEDSSNETPLSETADAVDQPQMMYYINDGVYGAFNCILFDHQKVTPYVLTLSRKSVEPGDMSFAAGVGTPLHDMQPSSVWGPTCDAIDCVCPIVMLPKSLEVGDWLGFGNMGAYTICAASQFNGFETSKVVYTAGSGGLGLRVQEVLRLAAQI